MKPALRVRAAVNDVIELAELRKLNADRRRLIDGISARLAELKRLTPTASLAELAPIASELHSLSDVVERTTDEVIRDDRRILALEKRLS